MLITYNKNPLFTTIELNSFEQKELWYKIKINEMENLLLETSFHIQENQYFDIEQARNFVNEGYYSSDKNIKSPLDSHCDILFKSYLESLMSFHVGDCTCIPCSCSKCVAESLLGINTIEYLTPHVAYKINLAFGRSNENTTEQAIYYLANYTPKKDSSWDNYSQEDFDKHIPRWIEESKKSHDYLVSYSNTYLNLNANIIDR